MHSQTKRMNAEPGPEPKTGYHEFPRTSSPSLDQDDGYQSDG